jgi:hypothetical protein
VRQCDSFFKYILNNALFWLHNFLVCLYQFTNCVLKLFFTILFLFFLHFLFFFIVILWLWINILLCLLIFMTLISKLTEGCITCHVNTFEDFKHLCTRIVYLWNDAFNYITHCLTQILKICYFFIDNLLIFIASSHLHIFHQHIQILLKHSFNIIERLQLGVQIFLIHPQFTWKCLK